jgi:streptogramin lyase
MGASGSRAILGSLRASRLPVACLAVLLVLGLCTRAAADPVGHISEFRLSPDAQPGGITWGPDGNLWFVDAHLSLTDGFTYAIGRFDPTTKRVTDFNNGLPAGAAPDDVAAYCGYIYFTDAGTHEIGRLDPSTGLITEFASGLNPGSKPFSIATRALGGVLFTDQGTTPAIGSIGCDGSITEYSSGLKPGSVPVGLAPDNGNKVWFTDEGTTSAIGYLDLGTGKITESGAGLNPGSAPGSIAAGPDGNFWFGDGGKTRAIGRIIPSTGQVTEFDSKNGLKSDSDPVSLAPGQDGSVWFADDGATTAAIGRITPQGQITEFDSADGLNPDSIPLTITTGADGNLWFTETGFSAIARITTGALPQVIAGPLVQGSRRVGAAQTCALITSPWAGINPGVAYQWLLDGHRLSGATRAGYSPVSAQLGHKLSCQVRVGVPFPFSLLGSRLTIPAVKVLPYPFSRPILFPLRFHLGGRKVSGHCVKQTAVNRGDPVCSRPIRLHIRFKLLAATKVRLNVARQGLGRKVRGRCVKPTGRNRRKPGCSRFVVLNGRTTLAGQAGPNQFVFTGRIGGHSIIPGHRLIPHNPIRYQLIITPLGGATRKVSFMLVP